ncbi:Isoprenylcysteine carboxyl methyltransferase [Nitrobacter hamburgensis X14]|uniref:Isoprenylcysteine carboxyl methyltransferase n=1 Tax=Nitrobacter hamburgensis (strain DSM 10229 / NCIMB 13809 / X14) TaxID=323097 RepID=Q1QKA1_NITHX|nr:isoprenylcysteine carboxylmethyltransferase family protein [Nitrobacter hamburgensis]ABE63346.1 Isoprenylcysteine carboxyl methyltransferase [Nitrobacter hamburgensis X14]
MNDKRDLIRRSMIQNTVWIVVLGALLFISAGSLHWPAAWLFLATLGGLSILGGLWFAKINPGLLAERMRPMMQKGQPNADKVFMLVIGPVSMIWLIVMGLDQRHQWSGMASGFQALGFALFILSLAISFWVMRENTFAAPVVKIQVERGHQVIRTGPYAFVRHPMYGGAIFFFLGVSLLLGSWWGAAMTPIFTGLFAGRAVIEERTLIAGLPGYRDYIGQVRYRLLPGIW